MKLTLVIFHLVFCVVHCQYIVQFFKFVNQINVTITSESIDIYRDIELEMFTNQNITKENLIADEYGIRDVIYNFSIIPDNYDVGDKVPVAARMWGRAVLFVLVISGVSSVGNTSTSSNASQQELKVGRAINVFSRLGYLGITMRVVPRNDSDQSWVFREETVDVFNSIDYLVNQRRRNNSKEPLFDGDFHMEFCDNLRQLLQAYFRDFALERFQRPWRAFTGSWVPEIVARNMGINSSFVNGDHCYVLVRLSRFRDGAKLEQLPNNVRLVNLVEKEIAGIQVGNVASVLQFIKRFGSHYIQSYVTGNALYQVFVYQRPIYNRIKERLKSRGVSDLMNSELQNYFSPWFAEHMGQIRVASGNRTVERWANANLRMNYYIFSYASLLKLHEDTSLLQTLNNLLRNEALLQIDLRTLAPAFKDPLKRAWFEEVLDNYIKLWEANM